MEKKMYRADYDVIKDGKVIDGKNEYFWDESDDNVVDAAQELALYGVDYADIGHCELELIQIVEVDETKECLPDVRIVWW